MTAASDTWRCMPEARDDGTARGASLLDVTAERAKKNPPESTVINTNGAGDTRHHPSHENIPENDIELAKRLGMSRGRRAPEAEPLSAPPISDEEIRTARPSPDCIVDRLLYADVGVLIAPGGVGKTTLTMYVSMCIALGFPVFGERVFKPGRVLFLTAEDSREILVARLRACMETLTDAEKCIVMDGVRIADVSGAGFKLTSVVGDVVMPSYQVDGVLELCRKIRPVLIVIDPAVSFGVGESRVNDAEQGLVEAARRLRNALNCCVLYIHHSGKANAREKTLDQYSGRGGSAFADGSRMVMVLQNLTPDEWQNATGETLAGGETGLILARPKISYCSPPGDIYIRRTGFRFERVEISPASKTAKLEAAAEQVWLLLKNELASGRYHSKNSLEHADAGIMKRPELRRALSWLEASGRVETKSRTDTGQGGARTYLHPVGSPSAPCEPRPETVEKPVLASPAETAVFASPPLREMIWRRSKPPIHIPLFPCFAKTLRRSNGEPANQHAAAGFVVENPSASHLEILDQYPDALAAESFEPVRQQSVAEPNDDRITCVQCVNLRGRMCAAASPGGLVSAMTGYKPMLNILRRCEGYAPGTDDQVSLPGQERWPDLIQEGNK